MHNFEELPNDAFPLRLKLIEYEQGKDPNLAKKAPKRLKRLKNFIDRLILKELDEDISEDILVKKTKSDNDISNKQKDVSPLLKRNLNSLKNMAEKLGVSKQELIRMIKDE